MLTAIAKPNGQKNFGGFPAVLILNCSDPDLIGTFYYLKNNGVIEPDLPILVQFDPQDQFCKPIPLNRFDTTDKFCCS